MNLVSLFILSSLFSFFPFSSLFSFFPLSSLFSLFPLSSLFSLLPLSFPLCAGRVDYEESAFEFSLHNSNICHQVRIVDDEEPESEEEFHVCVSSPNPLVVITTRCAAIHIIDNDSK